MPGQSVFLQSGREALLVETTDGSNALMIVGPGGKASVVEETSKGKLTKLPLSALKNLEAVAALAAGEGPPGALSGAELMKQVRYCFAITIWPFFFSRWLGSQLLQAAFVVSERSMCCLKPPSTCTPRVLTPWKQVIASAQWVLPQVDIYIGELSPFGATLTFTTCSSRSNASGRRIHRHSKPNGGSTFGVEEDSDAEDDANHGGKREVQVIHRRLWLA